MPTPLGLDASSSAWFIAELTRHIPEPRKHLVRDFGWYANKTRGRRARATPDHERDRRHQSRRRRVGSAGA